MTVLHRMLGEWRAFLIGFALLLVWQSIQLTFLLRTTRRMWALLAMRSDPVLNRLGFRFLLAALGLALLGRLL